MSTLQLTQPLPTELTKEMLGNKDIIRSNTTRGSEEVKISLDKIIVRENFNVRKDYGDLESLADSILENGQTIAGRVESLADGTFVLTDGHRRFKALKILEARGHTGCQFKAIVNGSKITEEQRILQMFTTQDNKPLLGYEIAELIRRLINIGYDNAGVAKKLGKPVAYVQRMLDFAGESPIIKEQVQMGNMSLSSVVELQKAIPSQEQRIVAVQTAIEEKAGNKKVKVIDVIGEKTNSVKDIKRLWNDILENGAQIHESKIEIFNFVSSLLNNELTYQDLKKFFIIEEYIIEK